MASIINIPHGRTLPNILELIHLFICEDISLSRCGSRRSPSVSKWLAQSCAEETEVRLLPSVLLGCPCIFFSFSFLFSLYKGKTKDDRMPLGGEPSPNDSTNETMGARMDSNGVIGSGVQ
jgi:hypothetical protein